jgi:hypothetical protein
MQRALPSLISNARFQHYKGEKQVRSLFAQ